MTTARSALRVLRAQAEKIAAMIKSAERGDPIDSQFAAKVAAAREKNEVLKIGIVMDDKLITIDMPWEAIRDTSETGLSEYILKQMRGSRDAVH